jgi:hypothetical protein
MALDTFILPFYSINLDSSMKLSQKIRKKGPWFDIAIFKISKAVGLGLTLT